MTNLFLPGVLGATAFLMVIVFALIFRELGRLRRRALGRELIGPPPVTLVSVQQPEPSRAEKFTEFAIRFSPKWLQDVSTRMLLRAGFYGLLPRTVMFITESLSLVIYIFALSLEFPNRGVFFIIFFGGAAILIAPRLFLVVRSNQRAAKMARELPAVVDLMLLVVSGGLGLTAALNKVVKNKGGLLTGELVRTLDDLLIGVDRISAFSDLAYRTGSQEVRRFADAIMKVDELGVSLTTVLKAQANEMRHRNRIQAREQAQKITVKILFPLILCFLPGLFIVVIGPALINIFDSIGL